MKLILLTGAIFFAISLARAETYIRDYGTASTLTFMLRDASNANDPIAGATSTAATDCRVIKDGGAAANCAGTLTSEGDGGYSYLTTVAETQCARCDFIIRDADASEAYAAKHLRVETTSNASAQFPDETVDANITSVTGTGVTSVDDFKGAGGSGSSGYVRITQ